MNYSEVISLVDSMATDDREIFCNGIIDKINTYKQNSSGNVARDIFVAGENVEDLTVFLLKSFMGKSLSEEACAVLMGTFDLNSDIVYSLFTDKPIRVVNDNGMKKLFIGDELFCREGEDGSFSIMTDEFNIVVAPKSVYVKNKSENDVETIMLDDGLVTSRHRVQSFEGAKIFGLSSVGCNSGISVVRDEVDPTKIEVGVFTSVDDKKIVSSSAEGYLLADGWFLLNSDSKPTKYKQKSSDSFESEPIVESYIGKRFPNLVKAFNRKNNLEKPNVM